MSNTATVDYDALAQQARGAVDYDALASQARGGAPDLSKLSPQMRANYIRNASPTQFEIERRPDFQPGFGGAVADVARSAVASVPAAIDTEARRTAGGLDFRRQEQATDAAKRGVEDEERKRAGHGVAYRAAAKAAGAVGVNVPAVEHAADVGDSGAILGNTTPQAALATVPLAGEGVEAAGGAVGGAVRGAARSIESSAADRLIGTTPERLTELKQFPQKITAVRNAVVNAEAAAKAQAKAAFPTLDKPIVIDAGEPAVDTGAMDANGTPIMQGGKPPVTTTWDALQEQRSDLLKNIAKEKVAIAHGQKPAFDIGDMYEQLHQLDNTMSKAALDQGGKPALAKLEAARAQWRTFMDDFHNQGSPLRDIIEAKPDETAKIVGKLTGRDSGPRALETLRRYGANTADIEKLLSRGKQPLAVDVTESGKLRAAGSDTNYKRQRLNESIQQATVNRMPSRAEASLPAKNMRTQRPSLLGKTLPIPAPRTITKFRLGRALKALDGSPTP